MFIRIDREHIEGYEFRLFTAALGSPQARIEKENLAKRLSKLAETEYAGSIFLNEHEFLLFTDIMDDLNHQEKVRIQRSGGGIDAAG